MKFDFSRKSNILLPFLFFLFITGCATYYQKSLTFREAFVQGEMEKANDVLDKNKRAKSNKEKLLYFLQKGTTEHILKNFDESNKNFEEAYLFIEDYKKNHLKDAVSLVSNPSVIPYTGEDFEKVLLHYYKALNYFQLNQPEEAIVECRRINNKLNELNDKYEKKKNRYKSDGFAHNLMGIAYESIGDVNNAYISYKNALNTYKTIYQKSFETPVPKQLKKDLLRTAYLNGFHDELQQFEIEFDLKYIHQENKTGELVYFWNNGLGPVKDEWSLNFLIVKGSGGMVTFVNEELGLSFPFILPSTGQGQTGLGDLKFVRVAFPKYLERKTFYRSAKLTVNNQLFPLEEAENINAIAFKTLEDRLHRELGNSLLRLALKQAAEYQARQYNQNVGALLSAANALSEKADTRNWQILPYSIHYTRIPLESGTHQLKFEATTGKGNKVFSKNLEVTIKGKESIFLQHHSLESLPLEL